MSSVEQQLATIKRGCVELIEEKELIAKLKKGKPLRVKAGFDPTAPDLHLGHTVLLHKLRQFQELAHTVIFLVGDFTATIGDPSGQSKTRPSLSSEEIQFNIKTYKEQAFKILDSAKTEVRLNSEWLQELGSLGIIKLAGRYTLARMLEREDFSNRYKNKEPLCLHEFLYPLLQGLDSVKLKADVEIGGTDQKFNLLVGRQLQKEEGQEPQVVLTMPLLEGTDGVQKMSKSYNNYIGIQEPPQEIYGKVMSISDNLMWRYYELLSSLSLEEIASLKNQVKQEKAHPKEVKSQLAQEMVACFYSQEEAKKAGEEFENIFKNKNLPRDIPQVKISSSQSTFGLLSLIKQAGLSGSNSEARRLVEQGGVQLNQQKVTDSQMEIKAEGEYLIQVGKRRFAKVIFKSKNP